MVFVALCACAGEDGELHDASESGVDGSGDGSAGGGDAASTSEPPELAGTLAAHNQVRRGVGVPDLQWDPALAAIAQAWAERCVDNQAPAGLIDHNPGREDNYPDSVGENIYGSTGTATGPGAVASWAAEADDYDYASNSCSAVCGHYTQVVWRTTSKVGCALHTCAGLTYGSTVVCDYSPAGNDGSRPY
jgi:uncharacterized protein YkwD